MILVTTGTVKGFAGMVRRMDELAGEELADYEIVAQIANCTYTPRRMAWFRYMEEVQVLFSEAELIVGHGGTGTTIEALKLGKRFVGVSDPSLPDDHQNDFLESLAQRGLLIHCRDLSEMAAAIEKAWRLEVQPVSTVAFGRCLSRSIEEDLSGRTRSASPFRAASVLWKTVRPGALKPRRRRAL